MMKAEEEQEDESPPRIKLGETEEEVKQKQEDVMQIEEGKQDAQPPKENDDCKASKEGFVLEADDDAVVISPDGKAGSLMIETENQPNDQQQIQLP